MNPIKVQNYKNARTIFPHKEPDTDPMELKLGESYEPLCCILRSSIDKKLLASCGTKIIVMNTREGVALEKMIKTDEDRWVACEDDVS